MKQTTLPEIEKRIEKILGEYSIAFMGRVFGNPGKKYDKAYKKAINKIISITQEAERQSYLKGLDKGARDMAKMCGKEQSCSMCLERLGQVVSLSLQQTPEEQAEEKECTCYSYKNGNVLNLVQCNKCGKNNDKIQSCPCHCHCHCGGYHQKDRNAYVTPYTWDGCSHCQPKKGKI